MLKCVHPEFFKNVKKIGDQRGKKLQVKDINEQSVKKKKNGNGQQINRKFLIVMKI